jgi:hypothetical protein
MPKPSKSISPTPEQIREARLEAGLSQTEAAGLLFCHMMTWVKWEHYDVKDRTRNSSMHPAFWELFQIKAAKLKGKKKRNSMVPD